MATRPKATNTPVGAGARRGTIEITLGILVAILVAGPFLLVGLAGTSALAHVIALVAGLVVLVCVALIVHGALSNRRTGPRR